MDPVRLGRLARAMISPRTGIVTRLLASPRMSDQLRLTHMISTMSDLSVLRGEGTIDNPCGGSYSRPEIVQQVLLEIAERYAAAFIDYRELTWAPPTPSGPFLAGDELPLYADAQYERPDWPFRPLTPEQPLFWVEGRSLVTGATAFVPAALTFIPYEPKAESEWLGPSTSSGMACHWSWARACLMSLWELCEREALAILWLRKLSLPRVIVEPSSRLGRELDRVLAHTGARAQFVDMTTDIGIPTVLAVLETRVLGRRIVTVGAAARATLSAAVRKSITEAIGDLARLRDQLVLPGPRWAPADDFSNVTDWQWHSLVYTYPEHLHALDFLTASPIERHIDDSDDHPPVAITSAGGPESDEELLARYVARVAPVSDVVAVTLTTRDIAELGLHVVKLTIPQLVPLNPDHRYPWLGHRRLYTVPSAQGWESGLPEPDTVNPYPHPFA